MSAEIIEKLDKLALELTMADESLSDLQAVVGFGQIIDDIKTSLASQSPPGLSALFGGISQVFDKFMMGDAPADSGSTAIEIAGDSVTLVREALDGTIEADEVVKHLNTLFGTLKEKFDVALGEAPDTSVKPAPEGGPEEEGEVLRSKISIIDENDVVIFESFIDESTDQINKIEEFTMALEENPDDKNIINSLFRVFHSLKGAAGFLELKEINHLCHEAEGLLDQARKSKTQIDGEYIDIVLAVRDLLEKGLTFLDDTVRKAKDNLPDFSDFLEKLDIDPALRMIDNKLAAADNGDEESSSRLGDILIEKKLVSPDKLQEAVEKKDKPLGQILLDMGATSKEDIGKALEEQQERKKRKVASIKVDTKKLNILLELVGELVISQAIVSENKVLKREENLELSKNIGEMAKITGGIQDHIMNLRMVPLKQTFQKMNRLVRDLSRKTNKLVNFSTFGEETEIDKTIVEQLNDPLVHLLRNSVDHGLESPEERRAAGKKPEGTITLGASQKGGNVVLEIRDDGAGIDMEKILKKAVEKGLAEEGRSYTDEEIKDFLFLPGFSTHEVATDISGRGVGMDVVRRNVHQLGGRIEIITEKGKGSNFVVKLPLTMAIVDGMLVRVGEERYIIPTVAISESLRPQKSQLSTVLGKGEVINVRGELIPLVRLHELFGIPNARENISEALVIIVSTGKESRGLLVDDLLGQQQVVIKNLDNRLRGIKCFSGSSILGDGLVGLI
ncbi:MAG: chemotaxis protein CheA, partial [Nitrospinota bacterium]